MRKNVLMVYPETPPDTYWGFGKVIGLIGRKASLPPLGLLTVAAMLPQDYDVKLVDRNVEPLDDGLLRWADYVFLSAMNIHWRSLNEAVSMANRLGKQVILGGPAVELYRQLGGVSVFYFGEAEAALDKLVHDLECGSPKRAYGRFEIRRNRHARTHEEDIDRRALDERLEFFRDDCDFQVVPSRPGISQSPVPRFGLVDHSKYATASLQYSKGCPHSCDFCNQGSFEGHEHRSKSMVQVRSELEALLSTGFRGAVFYVDNNFTADKHRLKEEILPGVIAFQKEKEYPFCFFTEASIDVAGDDALLQLMHDAGFKSLFVGIETDDDAVLAAMNKWHNKVDRRSAVRKIQRYGMEVHAGFIVGNDNDPPDVNSKISVFCDATGIPQAMVSLLTAMQGSELYHRLGNEGRLVGSLATNNTHSAQLNFRPGNGKTASDVLQGYWELLEQSYEPSAYFRRCSALLDNLGHRIKTQSSISIPRALSAFGSSLVMQGVLSPYRVQYLKFMLHALAQHTSQFPEAVQLAVKGHHFYEITRQALRAST